jgi:K(+)-stimulated pyrophosphate-energized sodium pump
MSELPKEYELDILDSVGNTAATGKGFIASAALTSLALFAAYVTFWELMESIF